MWDHTGVRILSLDCNLGIDEDESTFGSDDSLYDYDVVFWNPAESLSAYLPSYDRTYLGLPSLLESESARLINDVKRRRTEFKEFVEMGRCLVVFVPGETKVYVDTGQRQYSGTGRNRVTTSIVDELDIFRGVPIAVSRTVGSGQEIEVADPLVSGMFKSTSDWWIYRSVIGDHEQIKPLLRIKDTAKTVGGIIKEKGGSGLVLLLPHFEIPQRRRSGVVVVTKEGQDEVWPGELLLSWIESLMAEPDAALPGWLENYRFPTEVERASEAAELERRLAGIQLELDALRTQQAIDDRWKSILVSSGTPLERRVRDAFDVLGFDLEEGDPGRTDLRGDYQDQRIVIEVKGLTKSAAERNAAQLEKWVASELADGVDVKGILVVNTWRDLPLDERIGDDFPHQMLGYSEQRGHCLLTAAQLLAMVRAVLDGTARKEDVADSILATVGCVDGWSDLSQIFAAERDVEVLDEGAVESVITEEATEIESVTSSDSE